MGQDGLLGWRFLVNSCAHAVHKLPAQAQGVNLVIMHRNRKAHHFRQQRLKEWRARLHIKPVHRHAAPD
jgi:hypothetical protein